MDRRERRGAWTVLYGLFARLTIPVDRGPQASGAFSGERLPDIRAEAEIGPMTRVLV